MHCPTVSAENEKTPAWRIGASCQKTREKSVVGEKKNKQTQAAPRYIYSDSPASLKLLVGDFKMAPPLPATEWVLPCQNVFKCKIQTQKFPTFPPSLSSLLFFSHFSLPHSLFLCLFLSPPCFCPSFIAHRKGHLILLGGALIECCLCSGKKYSVPFSRWSAARASCLGEVSASHSEVHFSLKHDVYLLGPASRTVQVTVPFVRGVYDMCSPTHLS